MFNANQEPTMSTTQQEQQLIDTIKAKPGYQVFPSRHGLDIGVMIVHTRPNGVKQCSVWLGRRGTIDKLQTIAAA
jgi:hypothetical protein